MLTANILTTKLHVYKSECAALKAKAKAVALRSRREAQEAEKAEVLEDNYRALQGDHEALRGDCNKAKDDLEAVLRSEQMYAEAYASVARQVPAPSRATQTCNAFSVCRNRMSHFY